MNKLKGETCPLCNGSKVIWGRCCLGYMCGCMGMPVMVDCFLCKHTGVLQEDLTEDQIEALPADIKDQDETQQWHEDTYPEYFKKPE